MALYVYGIMRARDATSAVAEAAPGRPLESVEHDGVSALVSETPGDELRLRRDNILAHSDVLQAAFEHGPVLPYRFGTAVADADTVVRDLLAQQRPQLAARLEALDGKAEMQVKATYAEEPLLRSILAQDPELVRMVRRTQSLPPAATHFERIRIGEAVTGAVQARSAADGQAVLSALIPFARAHVVSPPNHERSVINAAFLIERDDLARFDQALEALSQERSEEIEFKLIGPMPPYSFGDRDWEEEVRGAWA
ncbi:MAG: GvpL/GvpF family gas vesicle protein [Solirubrobacterales bacterium]|nr:GvpL/GvpF family gas vesicle protein [Solirubrobacterales bacterium]